MENKTMPPKTVSAKLILAVFCAGAVAVGFYVCLRITTNIPALIGFNVPSAFVLWCVYYFAAARKGSRQLKQASFLLILVSVAAGGFFRGVREKMEIQRAMGSALSQLTAQSETSADSQAISDSANGSNQFSGIAGQLHPFMTNVINQAVLQQQEYLDELEAIGWKAVLSPEYLDKKNLLTEGKTKICQARAIVAKYRQKGAARLEQARQNIAALDVPEHYKNTMLNALDEEKAKNQNEAAWQLEDRMVDEFEKIVDFLAREQTSWKVQDGRLYFDKLNDANEFNTHLKTIDQLGKEQEQIQKDALEFFRTLKP